MPITTTAMIVTVSVVNVAKSTFLYDCWTELNFKKRGWACSVSIDYAELTVATTL